MPHYLQATVEVYRRINRLFSAVLYGTWLCLGLRAFHETQSLQRHRRSADWT